MVSRGLLHDALALPGFAAERDGTSLGFLLYRLHDSQCEVVAIATDVRRAGVGRALLAAVAARARERGCRRVWLVTTNNNHSALAFYTAVGWQQVAVHRGAIRESRRLKPEIPEHDRDGTPIEDEVEIEFCP